MRFILFLFQILFTFSVFGKTNPLDVFILEDINFNQRWTTLTKTHEQNFKIMIEILLRSESGKRLLSEAKERASYSGETIYDVFKVGDASLTDTTLIRKFSPQTPDKVVYESRSKVYINRDLSVLDAILDMAHELTHFTYRTNFNPYVDNFSLEDFIISTIEGSGGEVDAFLHECKILYELIPSQLKQRSNCHRIQDPQTKLFSRTLAIREFYKLGSHFQEFAGGIKKYNLDLEETLASKDPASFLSSAYGVPYPLAALKEYNTILGKVCENDKKRLAIMQSGISRIPASENKISGLIKVHSDRCQFIQ